MKKQMPAIGVGTTENGYIEISGPDARNEMLNCVRVTPEQVEILNCWLDEAKKELLGVK
jgi:hypothetical protein